MASTNVLDGFPPKTTPPLPRRPSFTTRGRSGSGLPRASCTPRWVQNHIAIGQVVPELSEIGSEVEYEVTIDHELQYVKAVVTKMPFYNPPHKTA